tara:strand:+ start:51 stop:296 length:246 start_codon:yes stop_codon:yes gene_type:complete
LRLLQELRADALLERISAFPLLAHLGLRGGACLLLATELRCEQLPRLIGSLGRRPIRRSIRRPIRRPIRRRNGRRNGRPSR